MIATDYLKKPYARRLTPDGEGSYTATIQEFPGLVADGASPAEAISHLEAAAIAWINAAIETGHSIPEPVMLHGYSGKIALRMPRGLHKRATEMASSENVSLNQWIVSAISNYLGATDALQNICLPALNSLRVHITANIKITTITAPTATRNFTQTPGPLISISEPPNYLNYGLPNYAAVIARTGTSDV